LIAFEVSLNGKRLTAAGADDASVISVILSGSGKLGPLTVNRRKDDRERDIKLQVGGLTSRIEEEKDEFLDWVKQQTLEVGDEIHVKVLDIEYADKPVSSKPKKQVNHERELFEYAKKHYFELRDKYENNQDATP